MIPYEYLKIERADERFKKTVFFWYFVDIFSSLRALVLDKIIIMISLKYINVLISKAFNKTGNELLF